ncbi:unnamed protein product [Rotaria sordida]|uniref:Cadherin domain-containing protein n=1 Tax=Rotaria sordida TaxID=392033 RepID=A0A814UNK6_9BILA|nr:unnamed protein product [Rotaria sordida]CAF1435064.1 unnamed protein product [Rotaria sordida]
MLIFYLILIISISAYDNNTIRIYIHEELPLNTLIYSSISLTNNLQWLPSSYLFQTYFYLNENQSLYTTNQIINREEFCEKKFCYCSECLINLNFLQTFSLYNISIRTIQIIIKDINDHSPTFKKSFLQLPIAENLPIDYEIPLESAIDYDYGLLSIQNYELYPIINNPFVLIKRSKPILKLKKILDREIKSNYLLKLIAYDGGQPSLSGEQNIEIIVTDVNDNAPIFDQIIYRKSLPENQLIDSMIFQIHANDYDEGENARLNYSIDYQSNLFYINEKTGEIYLKKSLDYEKQRSYSITIKAHDHGIPQLNNYATLIIDVTDVNDHVPNVLLTEVNGTIMNNYQINLSECISKDIPLLYIYVTDDDSGDNSRISCTLNDTRLSLIILTTNAYSLQISSLPLFDYELEQSVIVHLQCTDFGKPTLSTSIFFHIKIDDCNDNPPDIIFPLQFNQSLLIPYETTKIPFIITQFIIQDRDRFQSNIFSYSFDVSPLLNLSLTNNGTLILCSMPSIIGLFIINVTVYDIGNLTNIISIPINIYSIYETLEIKNFNIENTSLILLLIFFIIIFLAAILISICFLITCLLRSNKIKSSRNSIRNSSCDESTNSSNERTGSSQKTTIEVLEDTTNSSNRVYQYDLKQAAAAAVDMKVINTSDIHQRDFGYSEKVERYLTHLNNRVTGIDRDEGVYGSSDISSDHATQQLTLRPSSISSIHSSQQAYQVSLKRFEQLYSFVEHHQKTNLHTTAFSSDSLIV